MKCPECKSSHVNKNGHKKGKQNYFCVDCGRQFIECYQPHKGLNVLALWSPKTHPKIPGFKWSTAVAHHILFFLSQ